MIIEYVERVHLKLQSAVNDMIRQTGTGSASSHEDYKYRVGIVTGMQRALDEIHEIYREFMQEDQNGE